MTLNEFKAWLDGFNAAINGAPTKVQWETIQKKFSEVQAEVVKVTEVVKIPEVIRESYPLPYPVYPTAPKPWWEMPPMVACGTPVLTTQLINS
jgi:hypothetical protein